MEEKKAFRSLKSKLTEIMGTAAELHEKLPDDNKPVMDIVRAQIDATYRSLLISEGILFPASELPAKPKPQRKEFGEYGWVKLTEAQHAALVERYGKIIVERAIKYIDESAQQNGNRNGWKDWSLTIHKAVREDWGKCRSQAPKEPTKASEVGDEALFAHFMRG